ncbi:MAG: hypothetical protein M3501_07460, partial [Actinomycetota bacterium]|nr:hypothetical protein [Actinomycetota bacterium]
RPAGGGRATAGTCDAGEEQRVRRGLAAAGFGSPRTRPEIELSNTILQREALGDGARGSVITA